jgi:uncharacterized protein YjbI with pentapeptide repeats
LSNPAARPVINPLKVSGLTAIDELPLSFEDFEDMDFTLGVAESVETRKARFLECRIQLQSAVEWIATESVFRNSEIAIGRVGSLELAGVTMNSVVISGMRANFASLANSKLQDVLIQNCRFDTLDFVGVNAKRVRFVDSVVEDLDLRQVAAESLDLRGLDFARVRGVSSMRNATINEYQLTQIAADLAELAFIQVD